MATKKSQTGMNEQQLAAQVQSRIALEDKPVDPLIPVPNETLPEGFVNPPCGDRGHLCLDPRGRYQPEWYALKIHKNDNMPQRQYFNANGKGWYVQVGVWVDVPPVILTVLKYTEQQVLSMDVSKTNFVSERGVPLVVDVVPRFSYSTISSE